MPVTAIRQKMVSTPQLQFEDLLAAIARRDQSAMAEFYDQTHQAVFGLLCRLLPERATAEEVLLGVYEEVWREAVRAIKTESSPLAWLIRLARRRALDRLKASGPQTIEPEKNSTPVDRSAENEPPAQQRLLINRALMRLTPEQRRLLEFTYFNGLSYTEAANRLGLPPNEVKTSIVAGMKTLKNFLPPHSS